MLSFDSRSIRTWGHLGSCGAFGLAVCEAAEQDPSLVITTADLCNYSGLDRFRSLYPDRLYNMGIAEQNMVNVAAGMAKEGSNPFATTYATFAASRSLDQIRVSMGYMKLPVKLVGVTAGFSAGILGPTHMSCEDLSNMRAIPNIVVLSPADTTETVKATLAAAKCNQPVYLRLTGVMGSPIVYKSDFDFEIGKAIRLREGEDVLMIATGTMVSESLLAAGLLDEAGVNATVVDMHTIKPFDSSVFDQLSIQYKMVISAEEHSIIGGLGSAVAEGLASCGVGIPHIKIGVEDYFPHAAPYSDLLDQCGLTGKQIAARVLQELRKRSL